VVVVGSLGKTTTAAAVARMLGTRPASRIGLNSFGTLALAVLRVRPGSRHAVLEVGIDGPGQMGPYARLLRPEVVVVTGVASEHHRAFGALDATAAEKAAMVRALSPSGTAVLNGDEPLVRAMAAVTRGRVVTFGLGEGNDVRAGDVVLDWPHGMRFTLHAQGTTRAIRTRLVGRPAVYAILAALAVALVEGVALDRAAAALETLAPLPGRLQPVPFADGTVLLRDEFKSPVETIDAALDVLAAIPAARRLVVLGDVNEPQGRAGPLYRRLGARVAAVAAGAVFVTTSRDITRYRSGAMGGGLPRPAIAHARTVADALVALRARLRPGDVVLIKGRSVQRLERVALALAGRAVRCQLTFCDAVWVHCDDCPMLERGWNGRRVVL
jgi:UDP-N-acetylmuramyl pentapeptide synthase